MQIAEIDKMISEQLTNIYADPRRHAFYSCFQANEDENLRGIRNGKIRGKRTICSHCGMRKEGHAESDEQI